MPRNRYPQLFDREPDPNGIPQRRAPSKLAATAAVLALVGGAWLMHVGTETHAPPAPSPSDGLFGRGGAPGPAASATPTVKALPPSLPQRVRIPALGVNAPVMKLGVDSKNTIQVPPEDNANMAGWYEYGATPGSDGSAVLLGHVDTDKGPAVFYGLGSLHKGNIIEVARADHRTAVFTVYGVEVYAKADFPTQKVYDDTPTPELRVITCGGGFSKASHSYLGNVVVFARLTSTKDTAVPGASGSAPASPSAPASASASASASAPGRGPTAATPSHPAGPWHTAPATRTAAPAHSVAPKPPAAPVAPVPPSHVGGAHATPATPAGSGTPFAVALPPAGAGGRAR